MKTLSMPSLDQILADKLAFYTEWRRLKIISQEEFEGLKACLESIKNSAEFHSKYPIHHEVA